MTEELGLSSLRGHQWHIQGTCATTGDGIHEGFNWLTRICGKEPDSNRGPVTSRAGAGAGAVEGQYPLSSGLPENSANDDQKGFGDNGSIADTESTADTDAPEETVRLAEVAKV